MPSKRARRGKRRTYNTRRIKRDYTYFIAEAAELFALHRNAVRQWLKSGLSPIDGHRPTLIHGGDLIDFLDARQIARKHKCAADQFYCCRCRCPRRALYNRVDIEIRNKQKLNLLAVCNECGADMNRAGSVKKMEEYRKAFIVRTPAKGRISGCSYPLVNCHLEKDTTNAGLQPQK
jgi:hypothetical protein